MAYGKGFRHLTAFQKVIFQECLEKGSGGLSLPMGSGKTLLSLVLAMRNLKPGNFSLVVVAKSLIPTWELEINKFFGDTLTYEVLHRSRMPKKYDLWQPKPTTQLVITTPQTIANTYKTYCVSEKLVSYTIDRTVIPPLQLKYYTNPTRPFLKHNMGPGRLFSITWHMLIVDEIQQYTNIESQVCQGLIALHVCNRWLISGTIFDEPRPERVLGYIAILNQPHTPRNLPDIKRYVRGLPLYNLRDEHIIPFKGLISSMVLRKKNEMFVPPEISKQIVSHTLTADEQKLYTVMKEILYEMCKKAQHLRYTDPDMARKFSIYRLAMLTYLRQSIVCPLIPLASAALDISDYKKKSFLAAIFMDNINKLDLSTWLSNEKAARSSRIYHICEEVNKHKHERIVMFTCFRSNLNMIQYYLPTDRKVMTLTSRMNITQRGKMIRQFEKTDNGILLLTYTIGANGLNLQCSSTVMLCDFWWNAGKTEQAIARILRFGQTALRVNIIFFTSNTGLEQVIFEKQKIKQKMTIELMQGLQTSKIKRLRVQDIVRLIALKENDKLVRSIYLY